MRRLRSIRLIRFVALTLLAMVVVAPPSGADSSGSVTATVTPSTACITVGATTVDWGSLPFSTTGSDTVALGIPDTNTGPEYALTNCSSAEATFYGTGSNILDPSNNVLWYLDDTFTNDICSDSSSLGGYTGTIDRYYSSVITDTNGTGFVGDLDANNLGDSGKFLAHNVAKELAGASAVPGSGSITIGNQITMPCTGSAGAGTTLSTSIVYTAILNS